MFIALIPEFCVDNAEIGITEEDASYGEGYIAPTSSANNKEFTVPVETTTFSYNGKSYTPKNNKMWCFPFFKLQVSNHSGNAADYAIEEFEANRAAKFQLYGDISANPSVTLYPKNYKGITHNVDCGISINSFPQCSFNSDTFKLWLAKNQYSLGVSVASGVAEIVGGIATTAATGGAAGGVGIPTAMHGATQIFSAINSRYQASLEPNKSSSGCPKNNLLTAMNKNQFDYYFCYPKYDEAVAIDDFFTMYGYQTNKVKKPNMSSRPYFNYVKTIGVNITGNIPCDDLQVLKRMFDSGVTFWKAGATVGDYSVNNKPN